VLFVRTPRFDRTLTRDEREVVARALERRNVAPPEICRRAVEVARLVPREPRLEEVRGPLSLVAYVALSIRADGIALGPRVFIRAALFGPDGSVPIDLVAHEVAHVAQYLRDGTVPFCARYALAYARGLARGLDAHSAYLAIPYEREARWVAASVG
jgi:uncharacterized protein DUF4157